MESYYIVYTYNTEGSDSNVLDIIENYDNINKFFESCFIVYQKDKFDIRIFMENITDITFYIDIYYNIYGEIGLAYFAQHMKEMYDNRVQVLAL